MEPRLGGDIGRGAAIRRRHQPGSPETGRRLRGPLAPQTHASRGSNQYSIGQQAARFGNLVIEEFFSAPPTNFFLAKGIRSASQQIRSASQQIRSAGHRGAASSVS